MEERSSFHHPERHPLERSQLECRAPQGRGCKGSPVREGKAQPGDHLHVTLRPRWEATLLRQRLCQAHAREGTAG